MNRLAQSQSLYLQKHATNPIQWWPWCEEALTLAKDKDRPIFLSVSHSSCHWCTVMEGEASSDEAIAAAQFIANHQWQNDQQLGCTSCGFYNTGPESDALLQIRERSWQDNATPSANGVAIANLIRLSLLTGNEDCMQRAEASLKSFTNIMINTPDSFCRGVAEKLSTVIECQG